MSTAEKSTISLVINGDEMRVDPKAHTNLLHFLRNELRLTGTKLGCATGNCGACSVVINGVVAQSCQTSLGATAGTKIETVERIVETSLGGKIADSLAAFDAAQCGYCLPGIVVAAYGSLSNRTDVGPVDVLKNNLCRCGTHTRILAALQQVIDDREPSQ